MAFSIRLACPKNSDHLSPTVTSLEHDMEQIMLHLLGTTPETFETFPSTPPPETILEIFHISLHFNTCHAPCFCPSGNFQVSSAWAFMGGSTAA